MYDLIIRQAQVFDGLGNPGRLADVAVKDGVVAKVGVIEGAAKQVAFAGLIWSDLVGSGRICAWIWIG